MRKLFALTLIAIFCAASARADEAKQEVREPAGIAVLGDVDPAVVEHVRQWAVENLAVPVPLLPANGKPAETLDDAAKWGATLLSPERVGVVVLTWPSGDVMTHGIFQETNRVVVVNVKAMKSDHPDDERFRRRMERQVMRGIGLLYGLELSPNPQSAMTQYSSLEELDEIGRNFDPPWLLKFQEKARDYGIPLDTENPFFMLR